MHIMIVNRWHDSFADYGKYVDHHAYRVSYVTTRAHLPWIPRQAAHVEFVEDLSDTQRVLIAAQRCREAVGRFDRIMALSEFDLMTGAALREKHDVPGPDVERVLGFCDKPRMKEVLGARGIRVPRFQAVDETRDVLSFAVDSDGDLMLKPRAGAASIGCRVLPRGTDLPRALDGLDLNGYEVEEFVQGPIWHVDGLMQSGKMIFGRASRYVSTCYDFMCGQPLGSVIEAGEQADELVAFADRCLEILGLLDGAFHLEIIQSETGPVFLEVGARVGGGEIPFTFWEVYGVDLVGDWIRMEMGETPLTAPGRNEAEHAGFLMVPEPVGQRLVARNSILGLVEELYAEVLPEPGHIFDGQGGYETLLGRFRYRGTTAADVYAAIEATLGLYTYELAPADAS